MNEWILEAMLPEHGEHTDFLLEHSYSDGSSEFYNRKMWVIYLSTFQLILDLVVI